MIDREKVISTFEKIISVCKEDGCDFVDLTFEDAEQILAMLKEQEKTPVVFSQSDGSITTSCGNCGWDLGKTYSRCPRCQKELDWNALQE